MKSNRELLRSHNLIKEDWVESEEYNLVITDGDKVIYEGVTTSMIKKDNWIDLTLSN